MECNKDEAMRAIDMAEDKLAQGKLEAAKELAMKANRMFPGLPRLPPLITAIDVLLAASDGSKLGGDIEWHAILQLIDLSMPLPIIRMRYLSLVHVLHPDRTDLPAAKDAFVMVCQAWKALSGDADNNCRGYEEKMAVECNEEEAARAMKFSEEKLRCGELESAKKLALKAIRMFPGLEGLPEMIAVIDVMLVASSKPSHASNYDWYAILQLSDHSTPLEIIKSRYNKLIHLLHPDKNGFARACDAFSLVSQAWEAILKKLGVKSHKEKLDAEWNKEEALRAMNLAEEKLKSREFVRAKKLASIANRVSPNLERLAQLITVIDVLLEASKPAHLENPDWYSIFLLSDISVPLKAIRSQYKRLALLLHPDKNGFHYAEEAFKHVRQAWDVLGNESARQDYDRKKAAGSADEDEQFTSPDW